MGDIDLKITGYDWLNVFLIALSFSTLLSGFGYHLLQMPLVDGALFGLALGGFISGYSILFITLMNRFVLPAISKRWWNSVAALFSFLSGFFGMLSAAELSRSGGVETIIPFSLHPIQSAAVIGSLTYLIGALIYRFVKTRNEKEHIDTLFIQSRIRSLETQLNPHFLYNALNSLAELIHQNPAKAEAMVIQISAFLRHTMAEAAMIPLTDELRNVRDYIDLENIRFDGAIRLSVRTDEAIADPLVPKFSIQLLCENAIKHGMGTSRRPLEVSVTCGHENGRLKITVSNNGQPVASPKFGIGLTNLQERLSHLGEGMLQMERLDPPTFTFTLKELYEHSDRG